MTYQPQPVFRCPHCLSIRAERKHLGCSCPSCLQPIPAELAPAYWVTNPHPFQRSQGMAVSGKLLAGLLVGLCVIPVLVQGRMPAPMESLQFTSLFSQQH